MKKLIITLLVVSCVSAAFAYEKGEMYFAPSLGYHFFDNKHDLQDSTEAGVRLGRFLSDDYSIEGDVNYTRTDNDNGDSVDVTTVSANILRHYEVNKSFKPYLLLGVGGMFYDDDHLGVVGGVGVSMPINKVASIDLRVKDMFMTKSRNDIVPSVGLNFAFGKPAPVVKSTPYTPKAAVAKEEPEVVVAKVEEAPAPAAVAVAAKDSDKDGIIDDRDQCRGTAKDAPVDADGCPLDSDGDTVFDYMDKCPGTKKGLRVDADGCFQSLTLNINFKNNSEVIADGYDGEIKEFVDFFNENPSLKIQIQGHTDSTGTDEYNDKLSQRRADAVVTELTTKYGVDAARLTTKGFGETMPVAPNDTPENMRKNRRIESVIN